ncbi:hypothetical protein V8J84_13225 [Yoonia sp. 208BN28-4]
MGCNILTVTKGGGGEFERSPSKTCAAFGLRDGQVWEGNLPALFPDGLRLPDPTGLHLSANCIAGAPDAFEKAIIDATTAAALDTMVHTTSRIETAA